MKYGSVCSGIEAASVAWHSLGWEPAWFAEIEKFPSQVLAHRFPNVKNLGDMTQIRDMIRRGEVDAPDVLVGGTPCQAFSVAGLRKSLDDERGQLSLEFVRLADEIDRTRAAAGSFPGIVVWENVPGVLSAKDNAFGCFLGALAGEICALEPPGGKWSNAGYVRGPSRSIAWRVLDAQYFGVAQRRRRVFVVASARDDIDPAAILFESEGVRRDSAPSREAREETARDACPSVGSGKQTIGTLMANAGTKLWSGNQEALSGDFHILQPITYGIPGNWIGRAPENGGNAVEPMVDVSPCQTSADRHAVAYAFDSMSSNSMKSKNPISGCSTVDVCKTLDTSRGLDPSCNQGVGGIQHGMAVRRLTPVECERLQGFPDGWTDIKPNGKPTPDGPRYKSLGNSMAVPVMRWIGERIARNCHD